MFAAQLDGKFGLLVLVAVRYLADEMDALTLPCQVDPASETVQATRKKRNRILHRIKWLIPICLIYASRLERHTTDVRRHKTYCVVDERRLRIPKHRIDDGDHQIDLPCPAVRAGIADNARVDCLNGERE